ncbi:DUF4097 domain-containing protein [bacterium]|nr:DUF4097 domain-containing protein [bacterium]
MRRKFILYPITFITMLYMISCAGAGGVWADAEEEFHETYKLSSGTPVSVSNTNGGIKISSWDNDYVDVIAVKKSNRGEDELEKVEIRVTSNGKLSIETHYLENRAHVSVSYTISVPRAIPLENIKTTNGSIEINGTTGDATVRSTNGKIVIRDTDGIVDAQTTNGSISITDASGIRRAKTTNGSVEVTASSLSADVEIGTTNGSVTFAIPENLNADLDMKTTNGRIKATGIQMTVDEISKTHVSGRLGSGGNSITLKTTNGSITLEKL